MTWLKPKMPRVKTLAEENSPLDEQLEEGKKACAEALEALKRVSRLGTNGKMPPRFFHEENY